MGVGFQQNQWTPTPRRGPIAAELKSPGPALVDLPPLLGNCKLIFFVVCDVMYDKN